MLKQPSFWINKYSLTLLAFAVWMLFIDQKDFFTTYKLKTELNKLKEKKQYYQTEIALAQKELENLQHNPIAIEKFARERYLLKKDNETIFIVQDSTEEANSNQK